jgi:hypothetical protein
MTLTTAEEVKKKLAEISKHSRPHLDMQRLMTRYAIERFLWRVGQSRHADKFILKGAMAFTYYAENSSRTTKDADLMMNGKFTPESIKSLLTEIVCIKADDGVKFSHAAITVRTAGNERAYPGYSIHIPARLGVSASHVYLDISFGEAVTPEPLKVKIPAILVDKARYPILKIYPIETIIAEKYQTIVRLGMSNTRLKDHHDLYEISRSEKVFGASLQKAIKATFERRGTVVQSVIPAGLSQQFRTDKSKLRDWKATLTQHNMPKSTTLDAACESIICMIVPVLTTIVNNDEFAMVWDKSEWQPATSIK